MILILMGIAPSPHHFSLGKALPELNSNKIVTAQALAVTAIWVRKLSQPFETGCAVAKALIQFAGVASKN